ncbi:alpha/beta fold hydrolase [Arthrobacter sp. NPDC058127]|uniref:alpha/beta fold hydrolase n=1 Tax=Arthrobacter sp. NPDC058127 TaxID=3346351 RepID=UPI0036EC86EB
MLKRCTRVSSKNASISGRQARSSGTAVKACPVLLLHGHPRTSATWHRVAPRLVKAGFEVVCPDLTGYGRSAEIPERVRRPWR